MSRVDFVALAVLLVALVASFGTRPAASDASLQAAAPVEPWLAGSARAIPPGGAEGVVSNSIQWAVLKPQR